MKTLKERLEAIERERSLLESEDDVDIDVDVESIEGLDELDEDLDIDEIGDELHYTGSILRIDGVDEEGLVGREYDDLRRKVHDLVIDEHRRLSSKVGDEADIKAVIDDIILRESSGILNKTKRDSLSVEIYNDITGLGPLEHLMHNDEITEIMVNGYDKIYVEKEGKIHLTNLVFRDDEHVLNVINKIVTPLGRRCDEGSPTVDARLPDGSRVNAVIPPVSLVGPIVTIRKFRNDPLQMGDLLELGTLNYKMAKFLEAAVKGRCNIMVSGGTGSGKTTLLNVLSSFIPGDERIITIEDAAELNLMQEHVLTLESRPPNVEGVGEITIRDLVKNSLRMRPDRIVVGEIRAGEALDMLQAMNTGHDGSLSTAHANSTRDLIARLETMVLMAGMELPVKAIREQIASAIDLVVQQTRFKDGSRKITAISEIVGMEGDTVTIQDLYVFKPDGVDENGRVVGRFTSTGIRPVIYDKLLQSGVNLDDGWFNGE